MSIREAQRLPLAGGSAREFAFSRNAVAAAAAQPPKRPLMHASGRSEKPRKKADWFVVALYLVLAVGVGLIAWMLFALLTPSPMLPPLP